MSDESGRILLKQMIGMISREYDEIINETGNIKSDNYPKHFAYIQHKLNEALGYYLTYKVEDKNTEEWQSLMALMRMSTSVLQRSMGKQLDGYYKDEAIAYLVEFLVMFECTRLPSIDAVSESVGLKAVTVRKCHERFSYKFETLRRIDKQNFKQDFQPYMNGVYTILEKVFELDEFNFPKDRGKVSSAFRTIYSHYLNSKKLALRTYEIPYWPYPQLREEL